MINTIAKNAIYDQNHSIIAYELLYRNGRDLYCPDMDGNAATLGVIDTIFRLGLNNITEGKYGFINLPKHLIKYDILKILPKDKIGIEILEDVEPDKEIIDTCYKLKRDGYIIALDDFILTNPINPLVEIADIIKVDFVSLKNEKRREIIERIGLNKVKYLAEKVETKEDYHQAIELGYSFFQGYYFSRPEIIKPEIVWQQGI